MSSLRVISRDAYGGPVHCSYCTSLVKRVVVLPLTPRPELEARIAASDGEELWTGFEELWTGLCADCVRAMANALAAAKEKAPAP